MTERERMVLEETEETLPTDFHTFRHAYCTGLAAAGVNLQMQMALAGHTQAQTAMRYTQLAQTDQQQRVQGIPDVPSAGLRLVG